MRTLPFFLLFACTPKDDASAGDDSAAADTDTDTDSDTDTDTDTDTGWMNEEITLPDSPLPITIDIGGDASDSATFDLVECAHPPNNQFQLTYTNSADAYTWNMRVFVRETFAGPGTYSTTVQVQLLENFSGGRYYASNSSEGATVEVTVDDFGTNGTYGTFTTTALTGDTGDVLITPQPIAFWCDSIED